MKTASTRRRSKYVEAVRDILKFYGHATNAEITDLLREVYPSLSDTTVHRITQRLLEDNEIDLASFTIDGSMVFDINNTMHDHFECEKCGLILDTIIPMSSRDEIRSSIGKVQLSGSLRVMGTCSNCLK